MLAVAAHVDDGGPRPPELDWWVYRDWGLPHPGGWLDWPAREFARARVARNVYIAMSGYKEAGNVVDWCNANPQGWEIVASVLSLRKRVGNG